MFRPVEAQCGVINISYLLLRHFAATAIAIRPDIKNGKTLTSVTAPLATVMLYA